MTEKRNLVIGCDGTWNEPEEETDGVPVPTNVVKFMRAMKRIKSQKQHYESGVGTRAWESLPGGIYGYGLDKRVLGAYRFLCNRASDAGADLSNDRIFITGFSRGAYTARRLAGLIEHSGVPLDPDDTELGLELYIKRDASSARHLKQEGRFLDVPIEMIGVWDTVKATNDPDWDDHALPKNVRHGYHAMAIDERRKSFPVLRWNKDPRALEVWFAGVHSNVGGGYKNAGLSDIALEWMIYRAIEHGLDFKQAYLDEEVSARARAKMGNSFTGIWKALGAKSRKVKKNDYVHRSVEKRSQGRKKYKPKGFPKKPLYWPPVEK